MVEGRTDMRHGAAVAKPLDEHQPASEVMTAASEAPSNHAPAAPERTQAVYEAHAAAWDRQRHKGLIERWWLDRLLALAGPEAAILDLGCGAGEPIARHLVEQGCHFFLDGDDRFRLIQTAAQSGILTIGLGQFSLQRVRRSLCGPRGRG